MLSIYLKTSTFYILTYVYSHAYCASVWYSEDCSANIEANKQKLARNIADVAQQGAQLVILQELHNSLYFCQRKTRSCLIWQNPSPALQPTLR